MKRAAQMMMALLILGGGATAGAQTLDYVCDSGLCYADVVGFPTPPVRYEWISWPSGAVNFPAICAYANPYCAYSCPSPLYPTGYIGVTVYDGLNNLIGSDSAAVCN